MKATILSFLGLGGLLLISSCTTVEREPATRTSTSTTEQTTISRPMSSSVETQTIRY